MSSRNLRLQLIMDAAGNATRFLKGVRGDTEATSKALRAARERVTDLQRASRDVTAYRQMGEKLTQTRDALKGARTEAARLAKAHAAAERPTRQLSRAYDLAREKVRTLKAAEQGHVRGLQDLRGRLDKAGLSTKNLSAAEAKLARDTRVASKAIDEQRNKLKALEERQKKMGAARSRYDKTQAFAGTAAGAGASAIGAGAAIAAPLVMATRKAVSFQDAMLDVKKVVDFDTPEQFEQMNRDVLTLSSNMGRPAEGIAQIIAAAGQAKIPRAELVGFAEDAAKMGVAFGTSDDDAGEKMATWRTAFGMTQTEVRGLADQINYLGDNGNATALQISDVVTRIGPLGGVAGLAAGEVAALGATVVAMGVEQEIAATGIKNTMLALTKGEAATKSQQKAYAALGLEAVAVSKAMQVDAGGTIIDVMERIKKLSPDRQASILTQLFGSESVSAIAPVLTQLEVLRTNLANVSDEQKTAGSMAVEFANRTSGAQGAIDRSTESVRNLGITVGTEFLPQIKAGADYIKQMTEKLSKFAEAHPGVVRVVGTLVAIVAAALLVFGGLALAVAAILGPFALLQFALTGAGLLFAPLMAGLGGAAAATWAFTAALLANPITWVVAGVVALAAAAYLIYKNWGMISTWWAGVWGRFKEVCASALRGLVSVFMNFTPAGLMVTAFQRLWPALQAIAPKFREFGGHMIMGLINGVLSGIPALVEAVMGAGGRLISGFKERLGIHSPSRVFAQLGDYTMAGLTQGLDRSAGDALSSVARVGAGMTAALAVGAGSPAIAFDKGPMIGANMASAGGSPRSGPRPPSGPNTFHIYAAPGQDPQDIAREVAKILAGGGGSYTDDGEGFD